MKLQRSVLSRGLANKLSGTKLWRPGTKGRRMPGTTYDCVNLGLRRPEEAWDWTFCLRREKRIGLDREKYQTCLISLMATTEPYRTPGTKQIFEPDSKKSLIGKLSRVVEHPHYSKVK